MNIYEITTGWTRMHGKRARAPVIPGFSCLSGVDKIGIEVHEKDVTEGGNMDVNWKEVGFVALAGAIGGALSLIYFLTVGEKRDALKFLSLYLD